MYKSEGESYTLEYDGSHYAGIVAHTARDLNTGERVKFKVSALNANGEGPASTEIEEWVCLAPSHLHAPSYVSSNGTAIKIRW